ncbi:MAG: hypothetical protein P8Y42_15340, partial [Exilibacterium sp.]
SMSPGSSDSIAKMEPHPLTFSIHARFHFYKNSVRNTGFNKLFFKVLCCGFNINKTFAFFKL